MYEIIIIDPTECIETRESIVNGGCMSETASVVVTAGTFPPIFIYGHPNRFWLLYSLYDIFGLFIVRKRILASMMTLDGE